MKFIENVYYAGVEHPKRALDVYLPDCEKFPVLIYFHGGGITGGDKKMKFIPWLQQQGIAVVSANYRLYPDAAYPEFIKDAAAAVKWAIKNMAQYGEVTGYFVGGSSAGGYLTQMLCFDKKYLKLYGVDADTITGYIMDAGQPTVHFNVLVERGLDKRRILIDEAAPLYHISDDRVYPPMLIINAEHEMVNRPEQTQLLLKTLEHFKHDMSRVDFRVVPGHKHYGYVSTVEEDGSSIFGQLALEFINKYAK